MTKPSAHPTAPEGREQAAAIAQAVAREQIGHLYACIAPGLAIGWVLAAVLMVIYWRADERVQILAWGLTFGVWQLLHTWRLQRFRAAARQPDLDVGRWQRLNVIGVGGAALILGLAAWLFYAPVYGEVRYVVLVVQLGLLAGAVTVYGHHMASLWTFQAVLGIMLTSRLIWIHHDRPVGLISAALVLFYVGMLMRFGRDHVHLVRTTLELQHRQAAAAAQLAAKTAEVERASRDKSRFFAAASHDLRQPLHALGYYAELLDLPERAVTIAPRIRACVQALDDLFEGILDIARLDAGAVEPERRAFRLSDLRDRLLPVHAPAAEASGLHLRWHIPDEFIADSDPRLVERIVGNLLSNALRYTDAGGVLVGARRRGEGLAIFVCDTGPGLREDELIRVFDEFAQLHNPARDATRGVGLGLPTVRRLVRLLGHELVYRSRIGHGTCFELRLPCSESSIAAGTPAQDETVDPPLHGRVLVLDDHGPSRDALARLLIRWGLDCDAVATVAHARTLGAARVYDALFTDYRLPGAIDGLTFAVSWRDAQPRVRLTCVVSGEGRVPQDELPPGIDWLRKPVKPARLRALIGARLNPTVLSTHGP